MRGTANPGIFCTRVPKCGSKFPVIPKRLPEKCVFFFVNIPYKDAALELSPPSNSSRTIGSNKRRSRIVAAASRGTRRRGRIVSDDCQHATPRAIRIVRVASAADSRIERVRVPLTASSNHQRLPP